MIRNKEEKTARIVEVTVPSDFGLNRAERHRMTKHQDLRKDVKSTWALREIEVMPVVVGATRVIKKNLKQYRQTVPGWPSLHEGEIGAIKGTVTV